jgi:hypothetical protein
MLAGPSLAGTGLVRIRHGAPPDEPVAKQLASVSETLAIRLAHGFVCKSPSAPYLDGPSICVPAFGVEQCHHASMSSALIGPARNN